jgi:N-acetyl sugar amidotransferase
MKLEHRVCKRCIMDTSALDILFDENGVCSYCSEFIDQARATHDQHALPNGESVLRLAAAVKRAGHGRPYDCVVGVSGGVDSSWTLVQAVQLGLRPLAVHMDNGWNSELAQNNIANLVRKLGIDLQTHVINWEEYRGLMQAFFDADVVDVEVLYDNAAIAVNYRQAARNRVEHILAGTNHATEGMRMPPGWTWFKFDKKQIHALGRRGGVRLSTFPAIGTIDYIAFEFLRNVRWISFLDYTQYNKFEALDVLEREFGYRRYPYKHYESIFTRFYQGYLLPQKFGIDKRRVHLSTLIASGQLSRDAALAEVSGLPYGSTAELNADRAYFLKKMGWSEKDLDEYIQRPGRPHSMYPSERPFWSSLHRLRQRFIPDRRPV